MTSSALSLTVADGIASVTLTRGDIGNPINGVFCRDLYNLANELAGRDDVRAILLTAEGKAFSYGGDIAGFLPRLDDLPQVMREWTGDFHTAILRLQRLDAPIVAVVHGICAGGMVALVAGADFVLANERSKFVAAYAGIGLACDGGASIALVDRMGKVPARRFLLLNETLDAQPALDAGLIDELVPAESLVERGQALAAQLARGPTRSFGEIRRLLQSVGQLSTEAQLEAEAQAMIRASGSADAREGLSAFAAKRPAEFTGR